jgi:cytochrome c-type biogenesis protein CcmH/NrfG
MPRLTKVLNSDDLTRGQGNGQLNLAPYLELLSEVRQGNGVGGLVELEDEETQRAIKRRLSLAAKAQGTRLVWRTAAPGTLRFVLVEPGQPVPGGRPRRQAAQASPMAAEETPKRRSRRKAE